MSAIEAASAGVKDMADGSLRITLEFSPLVAKEAYALFGSRGTPLAVVALKEGFAQAKDTPPEAPKEKLGALCMLAVQWCADRSFHDWVRTQYPHNGLVMTESWERRSKEYICLICNIESRKELERNSEAAEKFQRLIRTPYMKYLEDK